MSKLEELRLGCFEELVDAELALGRHAELVPRLEAEIRREPLRERLRAQLMLALYRSGRQADALSAYQDARRTLVDELGLEPGPDLRRLETAILAQDPLLDAPVRGAIALRRRGRWLIALGAGALLLAAAAVALVLARGDQNTGLAALTPNSIGAIDPETGRIVAQVPLGAGVARLSASDDTVWGLSTTERTLYRVDASRRSLTGSARFDGVVADVAAAGDDVWVMHAGPSGRSLVTRFAGDQEVPLRLGSVDLGVDLTGATASTVGTVDDSIAASARTVWATTNAVRPRGGLALVDTSDERVRQVDLGPVYGLADDNETVWLVGQQLLWHLDSDGDVDLELPLASPGIAIDVASGESGVWAVTTAWIRYHGNSAQRIGRSLLTRVNAEAEAVETTIPVGGLPETVAAGLGSVWVTDIERNAVLRIDPRTNTVVETIRLGARPTSVALAGGLVWVAVI